MQTIDFETRNNYTLNVTVMDGGFPMLYDSAPGGVTPIDSIVTATTTGQNFDLLFSAF